MIQVAVQTKVQYKALQQMWISRQCNPVVQLEDNNNVLVIICSVRHSLKATCTLFQRILDMNREENGNAAIEEAVGPASCRRRPAWRQASLTSVETDDERDQRPRSAYERNHYTNRCGYRRLTQWQAMPGTMCVRTCMYVLFNYCDYILVVVVDSCMLWIAFEFSSARLSRRTDSVHASQSV